MRLGRYFWIRALVMVAVLFGVVWAKRALDPSPKDRIVLCPTRVTAVLRPDGGGIEEENMKWYRRRDSVLEELDPIAVEKWFSRNCLVKGEPPTQAGEMAAILTFQFVSGSPQILKRAASGVFEWDGKTFASSQLDRALSELEHLPLRLRPSR